VRYGRVPKRTRDIGGNSIADDLASSQQNASIVLRVVNSVSSSTAPSLSSSATNSSATYLASANSSGVGVGSQTALLVSSQMCSTTTTTPPIEQISYISADMIEASHMNNNNNNNNNNSDDNQELSVYDVILCVSQAHRTHCTYTESATKGLNHRPLTMPNSHHPSAASTINTNNLITPSSTTQINQMDENGVSAKP
jgi:hypothetical protein